MTFHYVGGKQVVSTDSISSVSNYFGVRGRGGGGEEYGCSALLLPPLAETRTWDTVGGEDTTQQQVAMTVHSYRDRHSEVRRQAPYS